MKILVTAFNPFGNDETNSSMSVLEMLGDFVGGAEIKKVLLPTVYKKSAEIALREAVDFGAEAILSLGQAGGRKEITVEVIGINYACAAIEDNDGTRLEGERLIADGENALFATLPVKEMVAAVKNAGFEASLSVSAGGFVCNSLLYLLLKNSKVPAGFVHLPYDKLQGKDAFSMDRADMVKCVEEMIKVIANKYEGNE